MATGVPQLNGFLSYKRDADPHWQFTSALVLIGPQPKPKKSPTAMHRGGGTYWCCPGSQPDPNPALCATNELAAPISFICLGFGLHFLLCLFIDGVFNGRLQVGGGSVLWPSCATDQPWSLPYHGDRAGIFPGTTGDTQGCPSSQSLLGTPRTLTLDQQTCGVHSLPLDAVCPAGVGTSVLPTDRKHRQAAITDLWATRGDHRGCGDHTEPTSRMLTLSLHPQSQQEGNGWDLRLPVEPAEKWVSPLCKILINQHTRLCSTPRGKK